ncbi:hypothetical protein A3F37_01880 [Candidatus Saccharibacteria bacterium RIFCSPHIGHO2_12_FULL_41_12]|nr:MAG: hypothetical protein A3F37_01880 [Candidatus Saccharibacteria bacterium RIFCSPHIGHO2_12_FULL_41_12]
MARHNWVGAEAEQRVCDYLQNKKYKILGQNWKTKFCEIDIIAKKNNCIYFVEVKYRVTDDQGGGLEVINNKKLFQMRRGAEAWVTQNNWPGEYTLSVAEVSGENFQINFIEDICSY